MSNTIKLSQRLDGVGEYYFSMKNREIEQLRAQGREIISLGAGSPDLPPPMQVIERLSEIAVRPDVHKYQSYQGAPILRKAFADWYKRHYGVRLDPAGEVLPLMGSKEGIMHICMTYLDKGDKTLVPNPGYPTYRAAVTLAEGVPVEYQLLPENGWLPDFDQLEKLAGDVKLMFVNYPNMPTGAMASRDLFRRLVEFGHRHNILIVHDNPYSFIRNDEPLSIMAEKGAMETAVELNSLSKSHNMSGWRVGVVVGNTQRIEEILRFKSNMDSGMFYPLQAAAAYALDNLGDEWFGELNRIYRERETAGKKLLDAMRCTYVDKQAGLFILARIPDDFEGDCYAFSDKYLHECGIFVTPALIFGSVGQRYIRICLCAPKEIIEKAALKALALK